MLSLLTFVMLMEHKVQSTPIWPLNHEVTYPINNELHHSGSHHHLSQGVAWELCHHMWHWWHINWTVTPPCPRGNPQAHLSHGASHWDRDLILSSCESLGHINWGVNGGWVHTSLRTCWWTCCWICSGCCCFKLASHSILPTWHSTIDLLEDLCTTFCVCIFCGGGFALCLNSHSIY